VTAGRDREGSIEEKSILTGCGEKKGEKKETGMHEEKDRKPKARRARKSKRPIADTSKNKVNSTTTTKNKQTPK
jgi:hypothetical protein